MTDAEREATRVEVEAALLRLTALQGRTRDGIHHLVNIFTIHLGEMDLAAEAAHTAVSRLLAALAAFDAQYPEFRR
jgi:hypothetical protein